MKIKITLFLILFIKLHVVFAQQIQLKGYVVDAQSNQNLPYASIQCIEQKSGTSSNDYGFFSIKLNANALSLTFSYIGYKTQSIRLQSKQDTSLCVKLEKLPSIEEVIVKAQSNKQRLQSTQMGNHLINARNIDKLPTLLGESDIIKQIRALPGINAGTDGTAGLIVRGSGPDQNLMLYDGVPIYNISHLNSFFSVFNTDAIAHAEVFKGAYPARYGGRISSVIDVRMREGNLNNYEGKISIGTLASKLTLEGPIVKGKASFILSARRTYFDLYTRPIQYFASANDKTNYFYDDYNLKVNYILNKRNRLFISGYSGKDKLAFAENYSNATTSKSMNWGNKFINSSLNSQIGNKLFSKLTTYYYKYHFNSSYDYAGNTYKLDTINEQKQIENKMSIKDLGLQYHIDYNLNNMHAIKLGIQYIYHDFKPNYYKEFSLSINDYQTPYSIDTTNKVYTLQSIYSHEWHAYLQDQISIGTLLKFNAGLHFSGFVHKQEQYAFALPRFSMVYMANQQLSLKAAAGMYSQYSFLVTNPTVGMPTDIWLQSVNGLKPMTGWQVSAGLMYNTKNNLLFNTEIFYKNTQNVCDFKEMVSFNLFNNWQDILSQGQLTNYGVESMIEYQNPNYNLNLSYSFIRATNQFNDLNNGNPYPYAYDSPHNISIEGSYNIKKHIDIGVTWCFASGKLITLPEHDYVNIYNMEVLEPNNNEFTYSSFNDIWHASSQRNNHRLPSYHRLDIGINFHKDKPKGHRIWSFGIYNAYNRKNVYYISGGHSDYGTKSGYQQYSISSIIPYAAYSFKF